MSKEDNGFHQSYKVRIAFFPCQKEETYTSKVKDRIHTVTSLCFTKVIFW